MLGPRKFHNLEVGFQQDRFISFSVGYCFGQVSGICLGPFGMFLDVLENLIVTEWKINKSENK